MILNNISAN